VPVPAGVKVAVKDRVVNIEGPKGKLSMTHRPDVVVSYADAEKALKVETATGAGPDASAYWGTTRALLRNMVEGVTKGYEKQLEVVGVGWTAAVMGKKLKLTVGLANSINVDIPVGLTVAVDKAMVKVSGPDKQLVVSSPRRSARRASPSPTTARASSTPPRPSSASRASSSAP